MLAVGRLALRGTVRTGGGARRALGTAPTTTVAVPISEMLSGVGQVVFVDKPASGGAILAGLAFFDPSLALAGAVGAASGNAAAKVLGLDASATAAGLHGYNGCLVGCAFAAFGVAGLGLPVAAALGGAATAPLAAVLGPACGRVPQYTLAFNATALPVLAYARPFDAAADVGAAPGVLDVLLCPLTGVGQIFVADSAVAGAAVLAGVAARSPKLAGYALAGSAVGAGVGVAVGAPLAEVAAGLYSFNSALAALAVGVFFVPNGASRALALAGAASSAVVFAGAKTALGAACAMPALTLPFCGIAAASHLLADAAPALALAAVPRSPEENKIGG